MLRVEGHCQHCLCAPCVISLPPDFLKGSCDAHAANDEKRHRLYKMFWGLLNDLGLWRDPEYLQRKEERTERDDRREILPHCVIEVSTLYLYIHALLHMHDNLHILSHTGGQKALSKP